MNTTKPLLTIAGMCLCASPLFSQKQQDKRPNILVIFTDDMGYSDIGCYGSEIRTPNIDRLGNTGLRFTQYYNTARSSSSRAALLTGLYPHQAGMGHLANYNFPQAGYVDDLSKNAVTLAEVMKGAGYATYMAGKWHVSKGIDPNGDKSNWPRQRGFDRFFGTLNGSGSFYDPGTLISNNTFIAPGKNFYYTNAISDSTVKFIQEHQKTKPFFFYVAFTAAHWPLHAPESEIIKYKGMYDKGWDKTRKARFEKLKNLGIIDNRCVLTERGVKIPAWENEPMKEWQVRRMETYAAMIDILDQGIGRIISALEKKGELDNTVVFYMHDNGGCAETQDSDKTEIPLTAEQKVVKPYSYDSVFLGKRPIYSRDGHFVRSGRGVMAGPADSWVAYGEEWANVSNTPYRLYKHYTHEGGIASPLIVNWPAGLKEKGKLCRQPSHLIDIMATCVDLAGAKYPNNFNGHSILPLEGKSLRPTFSNKSIAREYIFWEHEGNRAIRIGDWKLVSRTEKAMKFLPSDQDKWELYNLKTDPSETINLITKFPKRAIEMAELWEKQATRTMAKPWPW